MFTIVGLATKSGISWLKKQTVWLEDFIHLQSESSLPAPNTVLLSLSLCNYRAGATVQAFVASVALWTKLLHRLLRRRRIWEARVTVKTHAVPNQDMSWLCVTSLWIHKGRGNRSKKQKAYGSEGQSVQRNHKTAPLTGDPLLFSQRERRPSHTPLTCRAL